MADGQEDIQRTATAAELSAGTEVGGYVVEAKIGEGGMGVVYGAHHPRIGKRVAIKVLSPAYTGDPSTVERFEQEARLVNEIRHPNIVDVFQFGELPDGRSYFIMEWLEGESLSARLDRGAMPVPEAIDVIEVICDALEAAHEKNVVHRDLKSDNVFLVKLRKERKVKLLDFGLAKLSGRGDPASINTTKSGIVVGTPAYMSPEQARGKSVDHRTDIYALGCLAYKMLTGRLPFNADNAMDLIVQQLSQPPPSPAKLAPGTPPSLSRAVVRMMAKAPEERPTLTEIRNMLAELRDSRRSQPAMKKPKRAHSVLIGAGLFLCGVIALGVVFMLKNRDGAQPAPSSPAPAPAPAPEVTPPPSGIAAAATPEPVDAAAPAVAPTIEFEDDTVRTGSARRPRRPDPEPEPEPAQDLVTKPTVGAILLILEQSSQIELDGKQMSQDSRGGRFEVLPGQHTIRVKAPGREAVTKTIEVEPGATAVMRIADEQAPPPSPPAPSTDGTPTQPSGPSVPEE